MLKKNVTAIGYELIEDSQGLPVLHAMSEIAGPLVNSGSRKIFGKYMQKAAEEY